MSLGPVDLVVVKFSGNQFLGDLVPELAELARNGVIRVIDLLLIRKDANGTVTTSELGDLADDVVEALDPLMVEQTGLLGEEDVRKFAERLTNNSAEVLLVFENVWATRLRNAVVAANGELVYSERIPKVVIDELLSTAGVGTAAD